MFTKSELLSLKTSFNKVYPDYFKQLESCKTEIELSNAYEKIRADAIEKAKPYLALEEDPTGFPVITLTQEQYDRLKSCSGEEIKVYVTSMLDTAMIIQPHFSVGHAAAALIGGGIVAMGLTAIEAFRGGIVGGLVTMVAVAEGVQAVTVAGLVAIIAVAIIAIIIPILYFMLKPACCFALVLNELGGRDMKWIGDYNTHGKPVGHTPNIPPAITVPEPIPGAGTYVSCGIVQTNKRDGALFGTQYGFTYGLPSGPDTYGAIVSFGVECPLTAIYVNNNCYCAFSQSARKASEITSSNNVLSYSVSSENPSLTASIECNSGKGYVAYYIARLRLTNNI
ncbi:hypothetical protein [Flavivirga jejuensis]|uniref:Uncharacterized protein n=1 Tax=Flavivirga jejuensis TaxID=870487 RepID=A0ABT8WSF1_9FLAO|nr:hypothetical protein [Flavivirga jejuensis]MDO5976095.1 hypothetical protein [Flavivirga jejuensis]